MSQRIQPVGPRLYLSVEREDRPGKGDYHPRQVMGGAIFLSEEDIRLVPQGAWRIRVGDFSPLFVVTQRLGDGLRKELIASVPSTGITGLAEFDIPGMDLRALIRHTSVRDREELHITLDKGLRTATLAIRHGDISHLDLGESLDGKRARFALEYGPVV